MSEQPATRTPHLDIIERLQAEYRDRKGAELALAVREYAGHYGEELALEFIAAGFEGYHRDRLIESTLEKLDRVGVEQ